MAIGRCSTAPAEALATTAVTPAEPCFGITSPCAPRHSHERAMAPRLRGSVTPSSATTSASGRAGSVSASAYQVRIAGATAWWSTAQPEHDTVEDSKAKARRGTLDPGIAAAASRRATSLTRLHGAQLLAHRLPVDQSVRSGLSAQISHRGARPAAPAACRAR